MPGLRVFLLGPPRFERDGATLELDRRKNVALVAYLAVTGERHNRETLITLLWPELEPSASRANLRRNLSVLRNALGTEWLVADWESVGLDPDAGVWVDVDRFRGLVQAWRAHDHAESSPCPQCLTDLAKAGALYRGDFLAGFSLPDSANFEDWQFFQTEGLRRELASALERLVRAHSALGEYEQAIGYARRWLALDPLHEPVHRHLMALYDRAGQRAAALRQYAECERTLEQELGISPCEETASLYEQIRSRPAVRAEPLFPAGPPGQESPASAPASVGVQAEPIEVPTPPSPLPTALEGERRVATVVAARLTGSAVLLEELGTEAWAEIVNRAFQVLGPEIQRFGGKIDRFQSDGLVAFFGIPAAHEDDQERAVLAALGMQQAIRAIAEELKAQDGIELQLRVGVSTGELITAGFGGGPAQGQDTVIGAAIALAEGLATAAEPGSVLVSGSTYRLVRRQFAWEGPGRAGVEGVSRPVPVYRPLRARAVAGKGRGIPGLESPLVGREAEFHALQEAVRGLRAGVGGIVTLVGEAGIGKSRLVAELHRRELGAEEGLWWVEGRCLSYGSSTPYQLWLDVLRGLLGVAPDTPAAAVGDRLRSCIETWCPDRVHQVFPYLGRLMSLPLEDEEGAALLGLGGEGFKFRVFRAVEILVESAARQRPLVVVCEDLHWAGATTIELLEQLLALTDRVALSCICVFRPETEHGCWRIKETAARLYRHRHTDLWLERLAAAESGVLVSNLLPVEDLPQELGGRILEYAEGNPFYVEEIIRSLIDSGAIAHDQATGRWRATRTVQQIAIPDTLYGVLAARIDRLPAEARQALQKAAVIGRIFVRGVLEGIGEWQDLEGCLVGLQRAQMIRERGRVPEVEYIFKHRLTQEAAYSSLLRGERRATHRRVAQALERSYGDRIEKQVELLALHWERAGDVERAIEWLARAGEKARRSSANEEAVAHLTRALELVRSLPETPEHMQQELGLLLALGPALQQVKGPAAAEVKTAYGRALELCEHVGDAHQRFGVLSGSQWSYRYAGELRASARLAEQLLGLAQRARDPALLSRAHLVQADVLAHRGEFIQAREHCRRGLAFCDPRNRRSQILLYGMALEVRYLVIEGQARMYLGYPDQAMRRFSEALTMAQELSHPYTLAWVLLYGSGIFLMLYRDVDAFAESIEAALRICAEHGFAYELGWGTIWQGLVLVERGQVEEGIDRMLEGVAACQVTGSMEMPNNFVCFYLAEAYGKVGRIEEGLGALDRALAWSSVGWERLYEADLCRLKGELLLTLEKDEAEASAAEACFQQALTVARSQSARFLELRAATSLSRLWQRQGKKEEARSLLQDIHGWFTEGFDAADLKEARALLDTLA